MRTKLMWTAITIAFVLFTIVLGFVMSALEYRINAAFSEWMGW